MFVIIIMYFHYLWMNINNSQECNGPYPAAKEVFVGKGPTYNAGQREVQATL